MKKSNNNRSKSQKKRAEKNQKRLSDKTRLSKQQRWEMRERVRILSETLSQFQQGLYKAVSFMYNGFMDVTYVHPFWILGGFVAGWVVCFIQMKYGNDGK